MSFIGIGLKLLLYFIPLQHTRIDEHAAEFYRSISKNICEYSSSPRMECSSDLAKPLAYPRPLKLATGISKGRLSGSRVDMVPA